jgi:hypothetical protein
VGANLETIVVRRKIRPATRQEMLEKYPLADRLPNWFFRITETSNNAWLVEGCDLWGRKVSRCGGDPDALLAAYLCDAQDIDANSGSDSAP